MDGVRLTAPTILGRHHSADRADGATPDGEGKIPSGVLLAVAGSRGHKLACHYPPTAEGEVNAHGEEMVHGYPSAVLADLLIPQPMLLGKLFDLTIGVHRFVGFPTSMAIDQDAGSRALNVVFVLPSGPAMGYERPYHRILSTCRRAAQQLADALWLEESRSGFFSSHMSGLFEGAADTSATSTAAPPLDGGGGGAAWRTAAETAFPASRSSRSSSLCLPPMEAGSSTLLGLLREALFALRAERQVTLRIGERTDAVIGAPSAPFPLVPSVAAVPGGMPPPPPLRPYMGLLPLEDREETLRALPADASPLLRRLVLAANPLRSFEQLHAETGIPMPMILRLAAHLRHWRKMRVIHPLTQDSVLCIQPGARLERTSETAQHFNRNFGVNPAISFPRLLELFSAPQAKRLVLTRLPLAVQPFAGVLHAAQAMQIDERRLVQMTIFLLQRNALTPLHTYVHCFGEPPRPPPEADTVELGRWRMFQQLRPMLNGEHHLEEIAWQEGADRAALADMLRAFENDYLTCIVTPHAISSVGM
ncbi:hypothetical protein AB1Y20_017974 [Prymnesium parvum]|uniref:GATOR1 complex protein NPRL3 C-terminal HTH domain-containing protein n=1 Tax=Prymnesium parvum TaxID=97485 RepID=A0AB34JQH8_PRYPA